MTPKDKKELDKAIELINKGTATVDDLYIRLDEEYNNKPEKWQESDKGAEMQEIIESLDAIKSDLENLLGDLEELKIR